MLSNKVKEIMSREVTAMDASSSIFDVMEKMVANNVGRMVITENNEPIGMFTDHDVLGRVMRGSLDIKHTTIGTVMTTPVRWVGEEAQIVVVLGEMYLGKFCHTLVRDKGGRMVGIISMRRIFKLVAELESRLTDPQTIGSMLPCELMVKEASSSIFDTIGAMIEKKTRGVILLSNGVPKGIFTSRDVLNRVAIKSLDEKNTSVAEVMTTNPTIVPQTARLSEALTQMYDGNFRHLPVKDEKGNLTGMVTMEEILKYAKALDVDESVRKSWQEIKDYWESEGLYTPG